VKTINGQKRVLSVLEQLTEKAVKMQKQVSRAPKAGIKITVGHQLFDDQISLFV